MEFQAKLEFRGKEPVYSTKGTFQRYNFENSLGRGFSFVTNKDYNLEKGKIYLLTLNASKVYLNEIKGV